MPRGVESGDFIAYVHSLPPVPLAGLLSEILNTTGVDLNRLRVLVPEIAAILGRLLLHRDFTLLAHYVDALEACLQAGHWEEGRRLGQEGVTSAVEDAAVIGYYVGRLTGLLVLSRQVIHLELPLYLRAELNEGSLQLGTLTLLERSGPMGLRYLMDALKRERRSIKSQEEMRRVLVQLTTLGVVLAEVGPQQSLTYRITDLGRRVLHQSPPWLSLVASAYERFQAGQPQMDLPFHATLYELFAASAKGDRGADG